MQGRAVASLFSLLLMAVAVSGCISGGDGSSDDGASDMPTDDDFQGMDYIECMDHEDMQRWWNVFVPKTVDLSQDCLLYTSPSPRDAHESRMPSSA